MAARSVSLTPVVMNSVMTPSRPSDAQAPRSGRR